MNSTPHMLFVENAPGFGGSTRMLVALVNLCRSQGWQTTIAARDIACLPDGLIDHDHLIAMNSFRSWRSGDWIRQRADMLARRTGLDQISIADRCIGSASFAAAAAFGDLPLSIALSRITRKRGVTLIHANNDLLANRVAIVAGCLSRIPTISHQRGPVHACLTTRTLARMCGKIVAISDYVRSDLRRCGVPDSRTVRIYDGVDVSALANADDYRREQRNAIRATDDAIVVGLPAVLAPWKGHGLFLRAFAQAAARQPRLHALIVGTSPAGARNMRPQLEYLAATLGVARRVTFTGHMPDMRRAYAAMDIVVHASTLPEPFGLVVAEAMAAGKPVIAADAGGPPELIRRDIDGCLYPIGNEHALAESIVLLSRDPQRLAYLAHNARRRADDFALEHHHRAMAGLYQAFHPARIGQQVSGAGAPSPCAGAPSPTAVGA